MSDIRLIARDGKIIDQPMQAFGFAFHRGTVTASIDGRIVNAFDAIVALTECISQAIADDEARTSAAISKPGSLR